MLMLNLFGGKDKQDIFVEDDIESPLKTIINSFRDDKVAMVGLGIFLLIVAVMLIGPLIWPIDLSFSETSQAHISPGFDLLEIPKELQNNAKDISAGSSFSVGVDNNGKVYVWGKPRITETISIDKIPEDVKNAKIVNVEAGTDHVLAVDESGRLYAWGNDRHQQINAPFNLTTQGGVVDIAAGNQMSYAVTEDGQVYGFGNSMNNDFNEFTEYQGQIKKVTTTSNSAIALTNEGKVVYLGTQSSAVKTGLPTDLENVVDIASTLESAAAITADGKVHVWGYTSVHKQNEVPEIEGNPIAIQSGRNHYTVLTDSGKVYAWGANNYKQSDIPTKIQDKSYANVFTGFYQNYVVDENGNAEAWGLKGYLFGTDESGRDVAKRLLNGGRMSLFVGAVAVVISVIIGVIVGGVSGYYGGRIDLVLQRISEMVSSLPFLPFAMILSALIGNRIEPNQKTFMIMVVLGLLSWPSIQRTVRAQVLSVREQEYVTAARALGIKNTNIVFKHILPNVISVIIVSATLSFASSMLTEATLSFLGFGVQPPQPTWGNMLYAAKDSKVIQQYPWRWVYTSIVLSVSVICINIIGEGLRDAIDPKSRER
ncbi:MAG: ABC transporter permease subunit [Tissierellia bacterium]|nr:ABC transporter permease subunit [Tissierellia bacterium]